MEKYFRVKTTSIDYCVEYEDIFEGYWPEDQEWTDEQFEEKIDEIKASLPQELDLEFYDCEREDLDDLVCDAISDATGWLVNSFDYDIVEEK